MLGLKVYESEPDLEFTRYDLEQRLFLIGKRIGQLKVILRDYCNHSHTKLYVKVQGQLQEYQVAWYYHLKCIEDRVYIK